MGRKKNKNKSIAVTTGQAIKSVVNTVKTKVSGRATTPSLTAIKDVKTSSNQGIILINDKTMQGIFEKSGPDAKGNEFQTHYWSINYRHKAEDGSILDINIPTVYFNYEQEVSSAAIDFDLKDVKEISEKLEPIHNMKANQLIELGIKEQLEEVLGVRLESSPSNFNSIHRHPGSSRSQSFSGTDLTKNASEPGVVYPLASANETPNFAGIMAIDSGINNVAHYEYRVASGTLGTDIEYIKGRCAAITVKPERSNISAVEKIMGISSEQSYAKYNDCEKSAIIHKVFHVAKKLYLEHGFEAFIDAVVAENITERAYTSTYTHGYWGNHSEDSKFKGKLYRYCTKDRLKDLYPYQLNDMYKLLFYKKKGTTKGTSWIASAATAAEKVYELQTELGYTAQQPYGNEGIQYPFKKRPEYARMPTYNLRTAYEELAAYLDVKVVKTKSYSLTHKELMEKINALEPHFEKNLEPVYSKEPEDEEDEDIVYNLSTREFASDTKDAQKQEVRDAISFLGLCEELEFLDLETKEYDLDTLYLQAMILEAAIKPTDKELQEFGNPDFLTEVEGIKFLDAFQKSIKTDMSYSRKLIELYTIPVESKVNETKEVKELSIQEMKDELILHCVVPNIVNTSSDWKVKEMYERIVLGKNPKE